MCSVAADGGIFGLHCGGLEMILVTQKWQRFPIPVGQALDGVAPSPNTYWLRIFMYLPDGEQGCWLRLGDYLMSYPGKSLKVAVRITFLTSALKIVATSLL